MIYRFRAILDTEDDVFRDIEIDQEAMLEDFSNAINQAFGFDGVEMASFYTADDQWEQGDEISQFDMSEGEEPVRLMNETRIEDVINHTDTKLIYVYDFLNMWRFLVEFAEEVEREDGMSYPNLMFASGQVPEQAPELDFTQDLGQDDEDDDEFDDDFDVDDYDNLDFDENWN